MTKGLLSEPVAWQMVTFSVEAKAKLKLRALMMVDTANTFLIMLYYQLLITPQLYHFIRGFLLKGWQNLSKIIPANEGECVDKAES